MSSTEPVTATTNAKVSAPMQPQYVAMEPPEMVTLNAVTEYHMGEMGARYWNSEGSICTGKVPTLDGV